MKPLELKRLLERYSRGECTPQEEQFVDRWYSTIGNTKEEQALSNVQQELASRSSLEATLWAKVKPAKSSRNHFVTYLKVAAALFIPALVGAGIYFFSDSQKQDDQLADIAAYPQETQYARFYNPASTTRAIRLEDGSEVILRPKSEIRLLNSFTGSSREVYLTGEAFFKVKRDESRPFVVYSNEVVTRVLGTSFNIKAYKDDKEVTVAVKTGKVSVYTQKKENRPASIAEVILTPNQKVVYNRVNERVTRQLVEEPEIVLPNPVGLRMVYDGAPVTRILDVLEENYGVQIDYDEEALSGCVLTTSMTDEGLYERIEVICKAIHAEYTISDAVIFIKSRGCL